MQRHEASECFRYLDILRPYLTDNREQEDGSNCSIFSFDITANKALLPLAKNALKKLRTLRHPGVIKVLDTVEVRAT